MTIERLKQNVEELLQQRMAAYPKKDKTLDLLQKGITEFTDALLQKVNSG